MMQTTGQIHRSPIGLGRMTPNLAGAPPDSTRMQGAAFITGGRIIYFGDEAPMDFRDSLEIPWGDSAEEVDHLTAGYRYIFNVNERKLTIRNDVGNTIDVRNIKTLADLRVDIAIMESHQFKFIVDTDTIDRSGYVIGSRIVPVRDADQIRKILFIEQAGPSIDLKEKNDLRQRLADGAKDHPGAKQFSYRGNEQKDFLEAGELYIDGSIKPDDRWKLSCMWQNNYDYKEEMNVIFTASLKAVLMLYAKSMDLSADGFFTVNLLNTEQGFPGTRYRKTWQGRAMPVGKYLMIYAFAAGNLISSKPVVEPLMLWEMWQWLWRGHTVYQEDKIFDISPWWGA